MSQFNFIMSDYFLEEKLIFGRLAPRGNISADELGQPPATNTSLFGTL